MAWRRVLVFHIGSLGDTVLSIPALQALRAEVGDEATITLLQNESAPGRVAADAVLPSGLVDDHLAFPMRGERGRGIARLPAMASLALVLRRRRFDVVVNLALADRSAAALRRDRAFYRLSGITRAIGFEADAPGRAEAEARLDRLRRAGIDAPPVTVPFVRLEAADLAAAEAWLAASDVPAEAAIVTLAPGTLMPAKRWPDDRWVAVGRELRARGLEPIVVGGPADEAEGDSLVASGAATANAAGALRPLESAALLARAVLHVGVDTGTTHLAAAVGTRVVAIYSRRAPIEQWAPVGEHHRILSTPVPCDGCGEVVCPVAGHPCLTGVSVDEVLAAIAASLDDAPTPVADLHLG